MWYLPYLRGAPETQKQEYLQMYAGTRHILPPRGNNPRPNLFHMGIHALFVPDLLSRRSSSPSRSVRNTEMTY